ncbi:MAG: hypothetical protein KDA52_23420, partial [Planctomycetaceae bacterium]|nr:hypothetical protein [Planctomycetaceae bacterium]
MRCAQMTLLWVIAAWISTDAFAEEPLHLSFWDESDVLDTAGARIDFGANVLRADGITTGYPDMWFGCEVPRDEESAWVYGWRMLPAQDGAERTIEVLRAYTSDGRTFTGEEIVFSLEDAGWQGFANVVYRPTDGSIFLFSYSAARLRVF